MSGAQAPTQKVLDAFAQIPRWGNCAALLTSKVKLIGAEELPTVIECEAGADWATTMHFAEKIRKKAALNTLEWDALGELLAARHRAAWPDWERPD